MTDACSDPHLLLGEYALRMNFITLDTLQDVLEVWTVEKQSSLGQTLVERGHISSSQLDVLEQQVRKYLQRRALEPDQDSTQLAVRTHPDSGRQSPDNGTASDGLPFTGDSGRSESSSQLADQSILHFEAESLLDQSMDPHQEGLTQEEPAPSERRFQVLRPHAEGGIGVVSVAVDREFNREVAFKEIKRHFRSQKGVRKRFLLEAEVTARLEHPGIVPVYGLGYLQDGRPFYAMRLIRGETLKESIRSFHRKRISDPKQIGTSRRAYGNNVEFRELISRFIDVCFAIDYAHSRGVLHRDLKPGNIMLGKYGETLVVDWGLAKVLASSEDTLATEIEVPVEVETEAPTEMDGDEDIIRVPASRESLTETHFGRAIGTPAFMSPEQADGRMEELTATTDIYSLGATLYQILTGQTPINASPEGSRVSRLRQSELLRRVREGEFPHPRLINPNVSRGLESVCLKAMALHPDDRYQSVEELVQELQAWMADEPVLAWSEPWTVRTRRWVRGHQVVVGIAVTALLILAVVSPVLTIQRSQYAAEQKESAVKETVLRRRAEKERLDAVSARDAQARLASQARQAETLA
ncbi:MAG: serine/threonine-protein kinase, partial [Planctomycetaceae bacterium]